MGENVAQIMGERMSALRRARGLTLQEVADRCGIVQSHVWELEKGRGRNPTIKTAVALARTFGVSLDYLTGLATTTADLHPDALRIACEVDALLRRAALATPNTGSEDAGR